MGEINALEVGDINFNDRTIRVCKTVSRGLNGKTYISNSTKTKAGMRTIYFNDDMADFLKQCIKGKRDGFIFSSSTDNLITTNQVNYQYANALKKFDILDKRVFTERLIYIHFVTHMQQDVSNQLCLQRYCKIFSVILI